MGGNVNTANIADLIERGILVINDGYRAKNAELGTQGLPFARGANINDGFHFENADRFSLDNLDRVGEKISRPGDVVFTSKGTVGRFAFVSDKTPRFVYSPQLCFWRSLNHEVINPLWLFYWMHGAEFCHQYSCVKGQTDMADYVSLRDQRSMYISLPRIDTQLRVASILGSLDDKIEQNRRTNKALESMARAIFKAWFVDFEPVKAKAKGATSFPGMPQEVFDRLPDQLVETELGAVPKGWAYVPIGDLVDVVGGATPSTKNLDFWEAGDNSFCTPKDMSKLAAPVLLDTERHITKAGVDKISSGQLPVGTVLLSSRAPIGYLAVAATPVSVNQGIIAMLPREVPSVYVLLWTEFNMEVIKSRAGGSTFAEISKRNFRPIPALKPDQRLLSLFGEVVQPLFEMIISNERESGILARIRDTLLPKLISGELSVPDHLEAVNGG